MKPDELKKYLELGAFGFGALFFLGQLTTGQFNFAMQVALDAIRCTPVGADSDLVAVKIQLTRADAGRIKIKDILIESSVPSRPHVPIKLHRDSSRTNERVKTSERQLTSRQRSVGTALPPNDATQLGYYLTASPREPLLIDVTVLAERAGPFGWGNFGYPQWRASTVVLPGDQCAQPKPQVETQSGAIG